MSDVVPNNIPNAMKSNPYQNPPAMSYWRTGVVKADVLKGIYKKNGLSHPVKTSRLLVVVLPNTLVEI